MAAFMRNRYEMTVRLHRCAKRDFHAGPVYGGILDRRGNIERLMGSIDTAFNW